MGNYESQEQKEGTKKEVGNPQIFNQQHEFNFIEYARLETGTISTFKIKSTPAA
jgi:hypothetical protein